jgi:cytochrome c oxidase assembly protein subunit 15
MVKGSRALGSKKLVFQEVDVNPNEIQISNKKISSLKPFSNSKYCRVWLIILLVLIVCMVVVGGMTRLTDSGLSIVEWKPVTGILLPLSNAKWVVEFEKYKVTPEFLLVNMEMTLDAFKTIYLWEWGHRQLGRVIGLVWFVGFLWLLITRNIPDGWKGKFFIIGVLIGFQGLVGWWMVYSGLMAEMTDVASYRLATHLGMAFCIVGLILWFILLLERKAESLMLGRRSRDKTLSIYMNLFLVALFFQIILGALVAGIDAGTAYTDWPFMAGEIFPSDYLAFDGFLGNFLENPAAVQFNHRVSAYALTLIGILTWLRSRKSPIKFLRNCHSFLLLVLSSQVVLGIVTVIYGAPYQIAILHQLLGLALWLVSVWVRFETLFPPRQVIV